MAVGHPARVDEVVFARSNAVEDVLTAANENVGAIAAVDVDALGLAEKPDPHAETEIFRSECADRTDVYGVQ